MREEILFEIASANRNPLVVKGFRFGKKEDGKPSIAIVGALYGDAISQLYVASSLVNFLTQKEAENPDFIQGEILVIPSVNNYSFNIAERYWPLDKTDIDMMFPGYDKGETTQRIAHKLFEALQGFTYGITLENRKDRAYCLPYIKLFNVFEESVEEAKKFGFRFIHHRGVVPVDTVSLQYNWKLWGTKAFSIVFGKRSEIDYENGALTLEAITRFLSKNKLIDFAVAEGYSSNVITREKIEVLKAAKAGLFEPKVHPASVVKKGQVLSYTTNAQDGKTLEKIISPCDGIVTCIYDYPLIFERSIAFRIAKA